MFNRETYGILEWLGDIGGLTDALILIGKFLLLPFNTFNLSSFLLQNLFRYLPSNVHSSNQVDGLGEKRIRRANTFHAKFSGQSALPIEDEQGPKMRNDDVVKHMRQNYK